MPVDEAVRLAERCILKILPSGPEFPLWVRDGINTFLHYSAREDLLVFKTLPEGTTVQITESNNGGRILEMPLKNAYGLIGRDYLARPLRRDPELEAALQGEGPDPLSPKGRYLRLFMP